MVITSFRSGSTFLGDLLQQSDIRSYYSFEPLHFLTGDTRLKNRSLPMVNRLVQHLFQCNYKAEPDFFRSILGKTFSFFFKRNEFVQNVCNSMLEKDPDCRDVRLLEETCRRSRVQIIKFTRLNLADALKLDLPAGTKILYLQRDPRAIYNSRKRLKWCYKKECQNISVICEERNNDLRALREVSNNQIIVTRIEDMALNPMQESERLFNALGLQHTARMKSYLKAHTKNPEEVSRSYSRKRISLALVLRWKTQLSRKEILQLQQSCEYVIKNAGYDLIS